MKLSNFKSVVSKYKVVFFDAFGVLKTYNRLIPGIELTFEFLKEKGIEFFVLTNDASRSPELLAESFQNLGLDVITKENIISSGMLAREYLELKVNYGTVAYLGTETSAHYLETMGLKALPVKSLDLENIEEVNALVFMDDEGFNWNTDITKVLNLLRRRNIPVIVANTDKIYPVGQNRISIAIGAVARMIEDIVGKQFMRFGKPDGQMFVFAYERISSYPIIQKKQVLMVGDTLHTDILGGNKFGLDTVLVLTGNTRKEDAALRINATGIIPTYVCESAVVS